MRALTAVAVLAAISCTPTDVARLYHTEPKAPSIDAKAIENLDTLGATLIDKGINFSLYSERAERVEVLLFDDPESDKPTRQFPLTRFGDVWNVYVEGIGLGQHYGFIAFGPNWPYDPQWKPGTVTGFKSDVDADGNRFNPNKLLTDPWARALHRDHDWSKGSLATGPKRAEVSYAAASKGVVTKNTYVWSKEEIAYRQKREDPNWVGHRWQDLIFYEVHAKGFTRSAASGVKHPGTYRGMGEMADYLKDLGITAVELLPIHEKPLDGGYWGYQTLNFFAPELSYAFTTRPQEVADEFRWMVEELHKRNIEVIVDVVYNHTGEGGLWRNKIEVDPSPDSKFDSALANFDPKEIAGLYSYRGIDNHAYYALSEADQAQYWNNTGVGNQTRPNHKPFRRLIRDSLRYYAEEMHVDGFRFDLAPVLGERDPGYYWDGSNIANTVVQEIIDDPVMRVHNTRFIAEPWSLQVYAIGGFPRSTDDPTVGWYEWNGRFRDWWREFINCDSWSLNSSSRKACGDGSEKGVEDFGAMFLGSQFLYGGNGRKPYHAVNFVTVHDGFTMYDLFSYTEKRNKCGPLNPVCCDQPNSPFCDRDSGESHNRSRNWGDEPAKRQMMRNAFLSMFISHGSPLILGGDEWMRTQLGNNNAYSTASDNEWNWFDWGTWQPQPERQRMHDFVRSLTRFRKEHGYAFAPTEFQGSAPFSWKSPGNTEPPDWNSRQLMIHFHDKTQGPELAILINMGGGTVDFTLPTGRNWQRLIDTQAYFDLPDTVSKSGKDANKSANISLDEPTPIPGATYGVPGRSIVILEAKP